MEGTRPAGAGLHSACWALPGCTEFRRRRLLSTGTELEGFGNCWNLCYGRPCAKSLPKLTPGFSGILPISTGGNILLDVGHSTVRVFGPRRLRATFVRGAFSVRHKHSWFPTWASGLPSLGVERPGAGRWASLGVGRLSWNCKAEDLHSLRYAATERELLQNCRASPERDAELPLYHHGKFSQQSQASGILPNIHTPAVATILSGIRRRGVFLRGGGARRKARHLWLASFVDGGGGRG